VEEFQVSVAEFIMRYPNTIDKNFYLAYIRKENALKHVGQKLDSVNLNWDLNYPESLIEMCIKTISDNWNSEELIENRASRILQIYFSLSVVQRSHCV
jgi:hypothetical protein